MRGLGGERWGPKVPKVPAESPKLGRAALLQTKGLERFEKRSNGQLGRRCERFFFGFFQLWNELICRVDVRVKNIMFCFGIPHGSKEDPRNLRDIICRYMSNEPRCRISPDNSSVVEEPLLPIVNRQVMSLNFFDAESLYKICQLVRTFEHR